MSNILIPFPQQWYTFYRCTKFIFFKLVQGQHIWNAQKAKNWGTVILHVFRRMDRFQSKIPSKSKSHLLTEFFWLLPGIWKNISESAWLKGRDENHRKHIAEGLKKDGFLVPISKSKLGPEWALHFPKAEQEILWNLGCAKPVIRFLKQFRDARGITKLKVGTAKRILERRGIQIYHRLSKFDWSIFRNSI